MRNELWKQVSEVFQSALRLEGQEREAYLQNACVGDEELRRQVRTLLEAHQDADCVGFIGEPAVALAGRSWIDDQAMRGEVIDHYKILKLIGAGGMGEVYLADDTVLKRPVAIKVLLAETALDRDRIRRFTQEARAASALNHPNILTVYQVGDFKDLRFIVTEYIRGKTLRDKLGDGSLALQDALDIAVQVAAALDAAHHAGIVHRDIKPENIMVRDDGFVKVLDFGLAKLSGASAETVELRPAGTESETRDQLQTRAGTIMGTAAYMSPEQARGLTVDHRSDIWSLGVLVYEMVAGRQPFRGETTADTIASILNTEPYPITAIPDELGIIIAKALTKNADERYQETKELLTDLRDLKQDLEFTAKLEKRGTLRMATRESLVSQTEVQPRTTASNARLLPTRITRNKFAGAGGLVALALAVSVVYYFASATGAEEISTARVIESIAVLPFVNGTGNTALEYLSDGMTDSMINSLSKAPDLTVKARSSVFHYKGKDVKPQTVGEELSVQAALLGRVTQLDNALTFSLELVDTKTGDHIWGGSYTRKQVELPELQIEIARDVATALGVQFSGGSGEHKMKPETADENAFRLYQQGLYHLNKRTAEDIRKSIALFEEATEKDPTYAKAFASLASAYITLRPYDASLTEDEIGELFSKARSAVLRAQELNESLPEVHAILGTFNDVQWRFADAEEEYKRALRLNPNDASARLSYSLNLSVRGRHEDALAEIRRAYVLDPFSPSIAFNIGARYQEARRFEEAIAQFERVLEMEPNHALTHYILAYTLEAKGRYAEAIPEHRAADILRSKVPPEAAARKANALALALKNGGPQGYWRKRLEFSLKDDKNDSAYYEIAVVYARLGERDRALEYLERSFARRELLTPWIRTQSAFDAITDDPRFRDLLLRIGVLD